MRRRQQFVSQTEKLEVKERDIAAVQQALRGEVEERQAHLTGLANSNEERIQRIRNLSLLAWRRRYGVKIMLLTEPVFPQSLLYRHGIHQGTKGAGLCESVGFLSCPPGDCLSWTRDGETCFPCLTNAGYTPNVTVGLLLVE